MTRTRTLPALVVAGLLAVSLTACGDSTPSDDVDDAAASAAPVETVAPTEEPVETPTPEPEVDEEARGAALEAAMLEALGTPAFSDLLVADPTLWGGYVADVATDGGRAYITLQVASDEPARDDLGGRAAKALSTLLPAEAVEGIDWLIVQDASGVVIAQERPNPLT